MLSENKHIPEVFTTRPVITGSHAVVTSDHYLASFAGIRTIVKGGNAFDAAAATAFALAVAQPHLNSLGGEVSVLLYSKRKDGVLAVNGQGQAPFDANPEWFAQRNLHEIPGDGFLPAVAPGILGAWIKILEEFGTLTLKEVLTPAVELAEEGFFLHSAVQATISEFAARIGSWPTTALTFLPGGLVPNVGDVFRQENLARTLRILIDAEKSAGSDRISGLEAARREFYEGKIAQKIDAFVSQTDVIDATGFAHKGWLRLEDLKEFRADLEDPVSTTYLDMEVFKCGPWSQGPAFLEQLNILENFDLRGLGHNSADYLHLMIESIKLAYRDREEFYGDPRFDDVPLDRLLSKEYGRKQANLLDMGGLLEDLPPRDPYPESAAKTSGDTVHLDAIDREGNLIAATQSGAWFQSSPLVSDLGFALSTRGQMFFLDPKRNNCLAPGKRPRTTLTPSLIFKGRKPWMVFGTPGGDQQDQWNLQFFLNYAVFGMNLQEAIDAPTVHSLHFQSSFYPRKAEPNKVIAEGRIAPRVIEELEKRGHVIEKAADWSNGRVTAATFEEERSTKKLTAAASAKTARGNSAYALGW